VTVCLQCDTLNGAREHVQTDDCGCVGQLVGMGYEVEGEATLIAELQPYQTIYMLAVTDSAGRASKLRTACLYISNAPKAISPVTRDSLFIRLMR
jgi:hypothetical protein